MTIIKKFEPEQPKNNYSRKFISLAALVFFILILIQIWVSNTVVSYGEKFNKLLEAIGISAINTKKVLTCLDRS